MLAIVDEFYDECSPGEREREMIPDKCQKWGSKRGKGLVYDTKEDERVR